MKISEYIADLTKLLTENGDLDVYTFGAMGQRSHAPQPRVEYKRKLKGREHKPTFWHSFDEADRKGDAVVRV